MADFRKPKYSGSVNLAPECGPVLIELDTEAKTATASLEDPASEYTLAGGGGGLEYVIPEQTVTITDSEVQIEASITDEYYIIMKSTESGITGYFAMRKNNDGDYETAAVVNVSLYVYYDNGWMFGISENDELKPGTYTISAIAGF